jgi:acyl carrier protein
MPSGDQDWGAQVRRWLAAALDRPPEAFVALPDDAPLFGGDLNLDSFSGMVLLGLIQQETGLDLAADDLGLESLDTPATLAAYLREHVL